MKHLVALFFTFFFGSAVGQTVVAVRDSATQEPIEFAHIIFQVQGKTLVVTTDRTGIAELSLTAPCQATISFVGYGMWKGQLLPNARYSIVLARNQTDLSEVVVTAQYAPTQEGNSVHKVKVIRREDIDGRAAFTLDQLLNQQLNMRVGQDNALGSRITMNGIGGNSVKFLIDGVPVTGRLDGNIDLSQINLNDIERIEIIEGPMAVNFGSDALAGVINLITKKPGSRFQSSVQGYYESVGSTNLAADVNLPLGKLESLKLGVGRNFFGGWDPLDTARDVQWNQKEQRFGNLAYLWNTQAGRFEAASRITWELIKDKGNRRSPYSNYAFDYWYRTWRTNNHVQWSNQVGTNRYEVLVGNSTFNRSRLKYNRDLVNLSQELTPVATDHDTSLFVQWMSRGSWATTATRPLNHQVGYEFNTERGAGDRIAGAGQEMWDASLWGSANYKKGPWELQPGLRITYNNRFGWLPVPSINLRYGVSTSSWWRLSYARGYRAPGLKEMYLDFVDANHNIVGNPNLSPESSHSINFSYAYTWKAANSQKNLKLEPSIYFNRVQDMIDLAAITAVQYSYVNINQQTSYGAKLEANFEVHPHYAITVGGNWLGQMFDLQGATGTYNTPEVTAQFHYWRASKRFHFLISYKYTGATPLPLLRDGEQLTVAEIPAYSLLDITARQRLWKDRLEVGVGVKNLFDVTNNQASATGGGVHTAGGNFPIAWGRSLFVSLKLQWP